MIGRIASAVRELFTPAPARARRRAERSIAAALPGIATQDMLQMNASANELARAYLHRMRAQSRSLALNSDYAKHFLRMVEHHVVGPNGIRMQLRARDPNGQLDKMANAIVEEAFATWSKGKNCDVTGRRSFRALQKSIIRTVARDGECFARKVRNYRGSAHRFALQLIPAEMVDETYWDARFNIVCGIERDDFDRPVAYYLRQPTAQVGVTVTGGNGRHYIRIPAGDMVHMFLDEFPGQCRGIPWMHTAMIRLHQLGAYEEAEVMAARIGASKMGFITSPDGDGSALADGEDDFGRLTSSVAPGTIDVLPQGYSFTAFDPTHPSGNFGPFIKATLRGISSGLGVAYNVLASDLEGVNFSSIRAGLLEEREQWRALQRELGEQALDSVFSDWLDMAFLVGALSPLPASKRDKFDSPLWHYRGWAWVDPEREVNAAVTAIDAGLRTRTSVLAEQGQDFEEVMEQLAEEQAMIKSYGVNILTKNAAPTPSAPAPKPTEEAEA